MCACIIDFRGSFNDHLPLIEFSYNINYHYNIHMSPYEIFNGASCITRTCWTKAGKIQRNNSTMLKVHKKILMKYLNISQWLNHGKKICC